MVTVSQRLNLQPRCLFSFDKSLQLCQQYLDVFANISLCFYVLDLKVLLGWGMRVGWVYVNIQLQTI